MAKNPKVSVIIPVYNSEEYIGYCLNSVLCQDYTNLEIIIINDGSTDNSLSICKNYKKIDNRVCLYSLKNHGVSYARNFGIEKASGEYLFFMDSDDVIPNDAISLLVSVILSEKSDLVVGNILDVDFEHFDDANKRTLFSSYGFLKEHQTTLDEKRFSNNLVRLFYHTSLMECLLGKIYSAKIWRQQKISFLDDCSLGEDMLANLDYYSHCSRVTFIDMVCYYHGNISSGSNSLTHVYRKDLFNNQMSLYGAIKEHCNANSTEEYECLMNYGVSLGLTAIDKMLKSPIGYAAKRKNISSALDNPDFKQCLFNSTYINPGVVSLARYLKRRHFGAAIINAEVNMVFQKNGKQEEKRSLINCVSRGIIRFLTLFLKDKQKLLNIEHSIYKNGLLNTIRKH